MKDYTLSARINQATREQFQKLCQNHNMEPGDMVRYMITQFPQQNEFVKRLTEYHESVIKRIDDLYSEIGERDKAITKLLNLLIAEKEKSKIAVTEKDS